MALSAQQLVRELRKEHPEFWGQHSEQARELRDLVEKGVAIRDRLVDAGPPEMQDFLKWFEPWFVRKAAPIEVEVP